MRRILPVSSARDEEEEDEACIIHQIRGGFCHYRPPETRRRILPVSSTRDEKDDASFRNDPASEVGNLSRAKRTELQTLAHEYHLDVPHGANKNDLHNLILDYLLDEGKIDSEAHENYSTADKHALAAMKLKLELAKIEREQLQEHAAYEKESLQRREREAALKKEEAALKKEEREMALKKEEATQLRERCDRYFIVFFKGKVFRHEYIQILYIAFSFYVMICLSFVHKHLKAEEKKESEAHSIKEGEEMASTDKEGKSSDVESDESELDISLLTIDDRVYSSLAESPDSSPDKEHEVTMAEETEREERSRVQGPTDTNESGAKADEYLRYGKAQRSLNRPEIPQTSEVHKHLKAEEKKESEAHSIKEGEEMASTDKEGKSSDVESDESELDISLLTIDDRVYSSLAESPDSSPDKEHEVTMAEETEREERSRVQGPTDTNESGAKADEYLRYGKAQRSLNRPEIPQTSEVHKHLKAEEKKESEAHSIKEGEEMASTDKEGKSSDVESDESELDISLLTIDDRVYSSLAESPDSSPDKEHEVTMAEETEREERSRVQGPTDTNESGAKADEYLRYGKAQRSLNRPEIPQTSEVQCEVR
ncbi:myb-like protein X [Procambarus clarkii]|uniref:myb-like protein X n=1 Tax=Procambarus clarkii TaxID=6728 RepID=UPI00374377E0